MLRLLPWENTFWVSLLGYLARERLGFTHQCKIICNSSVGIGELSRVITLAINVKLQSNLRGGVADCQGPFLRLRSYDVTHLLLLRRG